MPKDNHRAMKEALFGLIGSDQNPVERPARENLTYGGVLIDTPEGPKIAYLRLTFEEVEQRDRANQQSLAAAREEGRRAGLEEAAGICDNYQDTCPGWGENKNAKVAEMAATDCEKAIRALINTPAEPVAEAARVLASTPVEDLIDATEAALHEMGTPRPKDSKQHHRAYFVAVCRMLAQKEGE